MMGQGRLAGMTLLVFAGCAAATAKAPDLTKPKVEAVWLDILRSDLGPPSSESRCIGVRGARGYADLPASLLSTLRRTHPGVRVISQCDGKPDYTIGDGRWEGRDFVSAGRPGWECSYDYHRRWPLWWQWKITGTCLWE